LLKYKFDKGFIIIYKTSNGTYIFVGKNCLIVQHTVLTICMTTSVFWITSSPDPTSSPYPFTTTFNTRINRSAISSSIYTLCLLWFMS